LNQVYSKIINYLDHLFFPDECVICENEIQNNHTFICHLCEPEIEYSKMENNAINQKTEKLFWGRIKIEKGFSLLYFQKGNNTQKILHTIKYQNRKQFTIEMGKRIGKAIQKNNLMPELDALIPVPIHQKKQFDRGYNQSELLCKGLTDIIKIKTSTDLITRKKNNKSQTKLNKYMRWDNSQNLYQVSEKLKNNNWKHIAIVDDVITTGSTIESIAKEILLVNPSIKISVISLAIAV
jgi:ComF family protein